MEDVLRRVLKHFFEEFIDGFDGAIDYHRSGINLHDLKMKKDVWQNIFCEEDDVYQLTDCSIGSLQITVESLSEFRIVANQVTFDGSVVGGNLAKAILPDFQSDLRQVRRTVEQRLSNLRPHGLERKLDDAFKVGANTVNDELNKQKSQAMKSLSNLSRADGSDLLSGYSLATGSRIKRKPTTEEQALSFGLLGFADMERDKAKTGSSQFERHWNAVEPSPRTDWNEPDLRSPFTLLRQGEDSPETEATLFPLQREKLRPINDHEGIDCLSCGGVGCSLCKEKTFAVGDAVEASCGSTGPRFGATVKGMNGDGTVTLDWNDGDSNYCIVAAENVFKLAAASSGWQRRCSTCGQILCGDIKSSEHVV